VSAGVRRPLHRRQWEFFRRHPRGRRRLYPATDPARLERRAVLGDPDGLPRRGRTRCPTTYH
jgi:hypothetical protein